MSVLVPSLTILSRDCIPCQYIVLTSQDGATTGHWTEQITVSQSIGAGKINILTLLKDHSDRWDWCRCTEGKMLECTMSLSQER